MPTYDYECTACSHTFEVFQSITAKLLRKCPKCGGAVRRLIVAGAAVIFKGSGFYETDYKRKKPPSRAPESPCSSCPAKAEKECDGKTAENTSKNE